MARAHNIHCIRHFDTHNSQLGRNFGTPTTTIYYFWALSLNWQVHYDNRPLALIPFWQRVPNLNQTHNLPLSYGIFSLNPLQLLLKCCRLVSAITGWSDPIWGGVDGWWTKLIRIHDKQSLLRPIPSPTEWPATAPWPVADAISQVVESLIISPKSTLTTRQYSSPQQEESSEGTEPNSQSLGYKQYNYDTVSNWQVGWWAELNPWMLTRGTNTEFTSSLWIFKH